MITLTDIKRTDPRLLLDMNGHYSQPKGFVGRNICYAISFEGVYYGSIVGGSSTLHLPGRDEFFNITKDTKSQLLKALVNNIFFHIEKKGGEYPARNIVPLVLKTFRLRMVVDWEEKYGDKVIGFESLVELPRSGDAYKRDGWVEVGTTKGYTCKRVGGKGTDSWSGKRVWDVDNLRPKRVFVRNR